MSSEINLSMLKLAHDLLEDLADEVVFVGGATTCLYVDLTIAEDIRPTDDVDCVIEITNRKEFDAFQAKLRKKGFSHDTSKGAPICRFKYGEALVLDVMPNDENILGFSNSWYKEGIKNKEEKNIADMKIFIFSLPYFLASKFEAFNGRGKNDPRMSWDLEDIVLVIDGIKDFSLPDIQGRLKNYLSEMSSLCIKSEQIQEAMSGFVNNNRAKLNRVNDRLKRLIHG